MDPIAAIDAIHRELRDATRDGKPARSVVAERTYPSSVDDVWDALTSAERIPRWLMPISGDLRLGGHYQLEGNAGGEITACDPPRHLAVTWVYGDVTSWVDVSLTPSDDDGTDLRLEHVALVDDVSDHWDEFGPGAVGVGWDLSLLGLGEHLVTGGAVNGEPTHPALLEAMRRSSDGWCGAAIRYGTAPEQAEAAAARTNAAYTGS
jgi:uncharacterized protein YndB with AHSA1/START domain